MPFARSKDPERCSSFIRDLLPDISTWSCVLQVMKLCLSYFSLMAGSNHMSRARRDPWLSVFADSGISVMSPEMGQSYLLTEIAFSVCFARVSFVELIREALPQFWTVSQWQFQITYITREFPFSFISQGIFFFFTSFNPLFSWVSESPEIQKENFVNLNPAYNAGILFHTSWVNWCAPQTGMCVASHLATFICFNIHIYIMTTNLWARHSLHPFLSRKENIVWFVTSESRPPPIIRWIIPLINTNMSET